MFIGQNIKYLRTKKDMTLNELAKILGYKSLSTVQKWESEIAQPPLNKVGEMAKIFNVDIDDLTNKDLQRPLHLEDSHVMAVRIPVYGRVAAGIPFEAIEDIIDYEEIPAAMLKTGEYFALKIKGDSMMPRMFDGDVVIVRKQEDAETGDTVIAMVNGSDACCKRLRKYYDGAIDLISTNPNYEPIHFEAGEVEKEPVKILGKVVELRQKY